MPTVGGVADPRLLDRPRLSAQVLATPRGGACVLTAEPGSGRRTLLRQVLGSEATVVALDPSRDAATFRRRLLDAVTDDGHQPSGEPDERQDLRDALARSPRPWLVLLDLDPVAHADLVPEIIRLIEMCPATHHVAITTTHSVHAVDSVLHLSGRINVIDQADLNLTPDEGRTLVSRLAAGLDDADTDELLRLCDGWVGALVTAVGRRAVSPEGELLPWLRTHGAERLVGPWLEQQSAEVHELLLDTALLDLLTPDLVDAVTGRTNGGALASLARPRGMVRIHRSSDAELVWFERHPLLTSLLRFHATGRQGDQERHRRAAQWFAAQRDIGGELIHLLAAGDAVVAAERFHRAEGELMAIGRADVALRWYESLTATRDAAERLLRETWALALSGRIDDAHYALDRMRAALLQGQRADPAPHPVLEHLEAEADVATAYLAQLDGDIRLMTVAADRAHTVFAGAWTSNSQPMAVLLLARGHLVLGEVATAQSVLAAVRHNPYATAAIGEGLRADTEAAAAWAAGDVHAARAWAARHDRWTRTHAPEQLLDRFTPCQTGLLCRAEEGDIALAAAGLEHSFAVAASTGHVTKQVTALVALTHVHSLGGQLNDALRAASRAGTIALEASPNGGLVALATEAQALVRLRAGDHIRAGRLVATLPSGPQRQLLSARVALVRGQPTAAALIRRVEAVTVRSEIEVLVLSAWACFGSQPQRAEQLLLRAADLAGQSGLTSCLVELPNDVLAVARRAASHHVHDPLVRLVRTAHRARPDAPLDELPDGSAAALVAAPLSRGELQLLALLPTRATYAGISAELCVSVNTVKTRLRRLYAKLGAHDRDDAIARATRLGLLGSRGG